MTLRTSATWWSLFVSLPAYLIGVSPLVGVAALCGMAWMTARCP